MSGNKYCKQIPQDFRTNKMITKLVKTHNNNKKKEIKAQTTNHEYIAEFLKRKSFYNQNKVKEDEMREDRLQEAKQKIIEMIKKRNESAQKILEKSRKCQEDRFHQRFLKLQTIKNQNKQLKTVTQPSKLASHFRSNGSINSQVYTSKAIDKMLQSLNQSFEILRKSEQKQNHAERNRKQRKLFQSTFHQNKKMHEKEAKLRAEKEQKQNYNLFIQRSIKKYEKFQQRKSHQQQMNQIKLKQKQKQQKKRALENRQKFQQMSANLEIKFRNIEELNKENLKKNLTILTKTEDNISLKRQKREEKEQKNYQKFLDEREKQRRKADKLYQREQQKWQFLTTLNSFKGELIQKNIYEIHQISLKK